MTQKHAVIKGVPPATRSRAFALWLALLFLYFMLLPSAADTPDRGPVAAGFDRHAAPAASPRLP